MRARYLVRLDDICPKMNWRLWAPIDEVLQTCGVQPILAVVLDNRDPKLQVDTPRPDFWEWVLQKHRAGWSIALHGYQHLYETTDAGLLGINARSEFAGLPPERQREKLPRAVDVFHSHGIRPEAFVATGHSFDYNTLLVLQELGITVISDGFFLYPRVHRGMLWVPQQMWQFRLLPFGLWTICLHHHQLGTYDLQILITDIQRFSHASTSLRDIISTYQERSSRPVYVLFAQAWRFVLRLKLDAKAAVTMRSEVVP
mgnify:CR=1 FL=1